MIEESEDQDASRMQAKMSFVPIDQLASYINNKVRRLRATVPWRPCRLSGEGLGIAMRARGFRSFVAF